MLAVPVLLLPASALQEEEQQQQEGAACLVWPLKWQCDQLCLESQPFFVPPAKASRAWPG